MEDEPYHNVYPTWSNSNKNSKKDNSVVTGLELLIAAALVGLMAVGFMGGICYLTEKITGTPLVPTYATSNYIPGR